METQDQIQQQVQETVTPIKKRWIPNFNLKKFTSIFVVVVMAAVSLMMVTLLLNRKNVSLNPDKNTGAANQSCYLELTRNKPTATATPIPTKTPSPTATPRATATPRITSTPIASSGVCNITFIPAEHQAVCWPDPKVVTVTYKVNSLPSTGGPFYMHTSWYQAAPTVGPYHYEFTPIIAGQTYTFTAEWPGIENPPPSQVEIHVGLGVYNSKNEMIVPNCTTGLDYYWTPYVCPASTPSPTPAPTKKACSSWAKKLGFCK